MRVFLAYGSTILCLQERQERTFSTHFRLFFVMADLNSRNGPSNKSSCEEEGAIEKDLVLQPVSPSCESSIASSSRPKRLKRKWPPRSPSPQPKGNQKGAHGDGSSGKISIKEEFCVTIEEDEDDDPINCTDVEAADDEAGSQGSPGQGASGAKQTGKNVRVRSKGQVWTHVCSLPSEEMFQKWRKESGWLLYYSYACILTVGLEMTVTVGQASP